MIHELTQTAAAFLLGGFAGALYFGGLWLTLRNIGTARRPRRRLATSFALRMAGLLAVFYGLSGQGWAPLVATLAGVLGARQLWLVGKGGVRAVRG